MFEYLRELIKTEDAKIFFIPVSVLVPNNIGTALLYTLYVGYLIMELQSILENYKKMGGDDSVFQRFVDSLKKKKE